MLKEIIFNDELSRSIIAEFGAPLPSQSCLPEVFGWYHFDGDTRYIVHDPKLGSWTSKTDDKADFLLGNGYRAPDDLLAKTAQEVLAVPADDAQEVAEKMALLHLLPTPPLPIQIDRPSQTEPFVHDGWLFAWYFFPEIKRWVLAPVSRR